MNCPKCSGKNGFTYNLIMKTNRSGDWGIDDDEEVEVERAYDVKTVTCIDCGKRIDWNVAHGIEVPECKHGTPMTEICEKCIKTILELNSPPKNKRVA